MISYFFMFALSVYSIKRFHLITKALSIFSQEILKLYMY
jgi:hypothetical protein